MTAQILDLPSHDEAVRELTRVIGPDIVFEEQDAVYANGGAALTVQDLCRMASNLQLEQVCREIGITPPE